MFRFLFPLLAVISLATNPTSAEEFFPGAHALIIAPGLYDVDNVASNDVLNIRAQPSAQSEIIGVLRYNQQGIEVVATTPDGRWGLVNHQEQSGWVALRFLRESLAWSGVPPGGLICSGTEPFWSAEFFPSGPAQVDLSPMGLFETTILYNSYWSEQPMNRSGATSAFVMGAEASTSGIRSSGIIRTELCSDGMSDRYFGFSIDMILTGTARAAVSGCCAISTP
jgi:uncharacterized membrane protein